MKNPGVFKFKSASGGDNDAWIAVGKLLRTVGLDGWVRVSLMTDYPERFEPGAEFYFQMKTGSPVPCQISDIRDHFSETLLEVKFEGCEDRDAVSAFIGAYLVIPKSERAEADDESFYPDEIQGLDLLSPEGEKVGKVVRLEADVPSPYLVIDSKEYGEVLIPFRKVFFSEISKKKALLKLKHRLVTHVPAE
jgi:16S rRNA processing protein RimM